MVYSRYYKNRRLHHHFRYRASSAAVVAGRDQASIGLQIGFGARCRRYPSLDEIGPNNQHADRLYAISAIEKKWRACYAYKGNGSNGGQPVNGVAEKNSLRSGEPECWNEDIASNASYEAFQVIVETIKGYVAVM